MGPVLKNTGTNQVKMKIKVEVQPRKKTGPNLREAVWSWAEGSGIIKFITAMKPLHREGVGQGYSASLMG